MILQQIGFFSSSREIKNNENRVVRDQCKLRKQIMRNHVYFSFLVLIALLPACNSAEHKAVITGDYVRVREKPDTSSTAYDQLFKGNEVIVEGFEKGESIEGIDRWAKIRTEQFEHGYVFSKYILEKEDAGKYLESLGTSPNSELLASDFSTDQIQQILKFKDLYTNATTSDDLMQAYEYSQGVEKKIRPVIQKLHDRSETMRCSAGPCITKFNYLMNYMKPMRLMIAGEGMNAFLHNLPGLYLEKAKTTSGNYDDLFFDLQQTYYGKSDILWPAFTERTWDYGGHSLLGQNIHLTILKKTDTLIQRPGPLHNEVLNMRNQTLSDIFKYEAYYEDQKTIIAELESIKSQINLRTDELNRLNQRIDEFKNPRANGITLNCKVENRPYG
jgi:hypothetical protein